MSLETKVRPTLTIGDLQIIAVCVEREIRARVSDGKTSSVYIAHLMEIKKYAESFNPASRSTAAMMLAEALGNTNDGASTEVQQVEAYAIAQQSPLDTDLTDGQKYDLLLLRKENERSDAENKWMLNTGTMVKIQRACAIKSPVNESDI